MGNFWLKLKIWTKVIAIAIAAIYLTFFTINNSERQAELWFFFNAGIVTTSVLKLVLLAFLSGAIVTILIRTTFRTISQIRDLKQRQANEKREREFEELKEKAGMLRPKTKDAGPSPEA